MTDDEIWDLADRIFPDESSDGSELIEFARQLIAAETHRCAAIARQMNCPQVAGAIEGRR